MAVLKDCAQFLSALPGIDWGDLYFQRSASRSLSYSDGKVEEVSSSSSAGCSARLLKGKSSAFAVVSGIERGAGSRRSEPNRRGEMRKRSRCVFSA